MGLLDPLETGPPAGLGWLPPSPEEGACDGGLDGRGLAGGPARSPSTEPLLCLPRVVYSFHETGRQTREVHPPGAN